MKEEIKNRYLEIVKEFDNIDESRLKWQLAAISKIRENKGGLVEASVGSGKTYVALFIIKYANKYNPETIFDVVVPNTSLYNDWKGNNGYINRFNLKNINVYIVNTYVSRETPKADVLIVDEVHRTGAETFRLTLEKPISIKIGLTGTSEREDGNHLLIYKAMPIVYQLSKNEAEDLNYIVKSHIYNLGIEPDEELKKVDKECNQLLRLFNNSFDLITACLKKSNILYTVKILDDYGNYRYVKQNSYYWIKYMSKILVKTEEDIIKYANITFKLISARKNLIYNSEKKIEFIKEILKHFPDKKCLIFCKTKSMADILVNEVKGSIAYYSQMESKSFIVGNKVRRISGKRIAEENLRKFKEDEVKVLIAINAINEGFNDPKVELIIQLSYDASKINNEQRNGRGVRIDKDNQNKSCIVINMYLKGTQEEKWLKNKQKNESPIWIYNLNSLYENIKN